MITQYKFIEFRFLEKSKSGKTDIYQCYNSENGTLLGKVSYYAGWYKYVFEPNNTLKLIFENQCLKDIAAFTEQLSSLQRQKRKKQTNDQLI